MPTLQELLEVADKLRFLLQFRKPAVPLMVLPGGRVYVNLGGVEGWVDIDDTPGVLNRQTWLLLWEIVDGGAGGGFFPEVVGAFVMEWEARVPLGPE
jgi:hypothetical protein